MCIHCEPAARTTATLTWAIPVNIVQFGANVMAYHRLKPLITQLRLCNRYGKGPDAFITRLPQELLDIVIDHITIPEQSKEEQEWHEAQRCYEDRCTLYDHYDVDEIAAFREKALEIFYGSDFPDSEYESDADDPEFVEDIMFDMLCDNAETSEICSSRKDRWGYLTRQRPAGSTPCKHLIEGHYGFARLDDILKSDFGLAAHIVTQTITSSMSRWVEHSSGKLERSVKCTLAYLTLPCQKFTEVLTEGDGYLNDEDMFGYEATSTFFNIIDPSTLELTDEQKRRFRRAMNFLGLAPFLHECQMESLDHGHGEPVLKRFFNSNKPVSEMSGSAVLRKAIQKRIKETEDSTWPKLLNLVSSGYTIATHW